MKYLDEFNDPALARFLFDQIDAAATQPWAIMEVCGGQTHSIIRNGIDQLLPEQVELIHGPGLPGVRHPAGDDRPALAIAARPDVIFCSFGDMLRVPGSREDLFSVKAEGGDVRVVYSPLDAVEPRRGTTRTRRSSSSASASRPRRRPTRWRCSRLRERGLPNFSMLVSHVLVPPAIEALMTSPTSRVQGFLAAGHVCTVMGTAQYGPLADRYQVPIVVTGFEPLDVLDGIRRVRAATRGRPRRGGERLPTCSTRRRQPGGPGDAGRGVRDVRPPVAWHRDDPSERLAAGTRVRRVRRGAPLRCRGTRW